jgi:hypothetical protein
MPVCGMCCKDKPLNAFRVQRGIVYKTCKRCIGISRRESARKRRIKAFKHFNERCKDCKIKSSSKNYVIFDFHHLDPSQKEIGDGKLRYCSDEKFWLEIKKCVLLCSNCHRVRHFKERRLRNRNPSK